MKKKRTGGSKRAQRDAARVFNGELCWGDRPASGRYDFLLAFCDGPGPEGAVRAVVERLAVAVDEGRFAVRLAGEEATLGPGPVWLAVAVRPTGSVGAYLRLPGKSRLDAARRDPVREAEVTGIA